MVVSPLPVGQVSRDRRGTALVEFAIALPVLIVILCGIVSYGSWLSLSMAVQQSANEGARAALIGLSAAERASIAADVARTTLAKGHSISGADVAVTTQDTGDSLIVNVSLDATTNPLLAMPLIPAPPRIVTRHAAVRVAGL